MHSQLSLGLIAGLAISLATAATITETSPMPIATLTATSQSAAYAACQFYSSVPGASFDATTMTLPACPSDIMSFSYTTTATTIHPSSSLALATPTTIICQFLSSVSGVTATPSTMTLPGCPSSVLGVTYSYSTVSVTPLIQSTTGTKQSPSGSTFAVSTFTGLARPNAIVEQVAIGGVGAVMAVAAMI